MSGTGRQQNQYAYEGTERPGNSSNDYNSLEYIVQRVLNRSNTATLVQIKKVTNTPGQVGPAGIVDVLPLVNQLDGYGNSIKHGIVHNIPYFRYGGGSYAILLDPKVGDIGLCVFADKDISQVKRTKAQANPGSRRRNRMEDGLFIGLFLGGNPTQYISFTDNGVTILDKNGNKLDMSSTGIKLTANVEITGTLKVDQTTTVQDINILGTETGGGTA